LTLREIEKSRNGALRRPFLDHFLEPWNRHDVDCALALMTELCEAYPLLGYEVVVLPKVGVIEGADLVLRMLAEDP
jgi:predicted ATPase